MKVGMYCGKFLPMHLGHRYCLRIASAECDLVYLIMLVNGLEEQMIEPKPYLQIAERTRRLENVAFGFDNVIPYVVDVSSTVCLEEGTEDLDAQTPLVRAICGCKIDAVYGSEPSYASYFARAYPEAEYRMVDADRRVFQISGAKIRSMDEKGRKKWMVRAWL